MQLYNVTNDLNLKTLTNMLFGQYFNKLNTIQYSVQAIKEKIILKIKEWLIITSLSLVTLMITVMSGVEVSNKSITINSISIIESSITFLFLFIMIGVVASSIEDCKQEKKNP